MTENYICPMFPKKIVSIKSLVFIHYFPLNLLSSLEKSMVLYMKLETCRTWQSTRLCDNLFQTVIDKCIYFFSTTSDSIWDQIYVSYWHSSFLLSNSIWPINIYPKLFFILPWNFIYLSSMYLIFKYFLKQEIV